MSATITIQLSPSAIALADKFRAAPAEFPQAIKRGMTKALGDVAGRIQEKRLSGVGPFPVALHKLGERTGQLKLRTRSTEAEITSEGNQVIVVTGAIGSSAWYAKLHEFGLQRPKAGKRKRVNIPERAPFRTGIRENIEYISGEIEKELVTSLKP